MIHIKNIQWTIMLTRCKLQWRYINLYMYDDLYLCAFRSSDQRCCSLMSVFQLVRKRGKNQPPIFMPPPLGAGGIMFSGCPSVRPLRLLGGWHFIAATAIKPPKAACQFAADDILLYKICYNIQWIYFTIWEKGKEELSPLQYHFKSLHIISRHYKKSLLRSQIYHGYEELSTDTNYPIWRRQKLPYMKKTRKKKQVCGAACFMAAEIKFSEDVRPKPEIPSFDLYMGPLVHPTNRNRFTACPSVRPSVKRFHEMSLHAICV